MQAAGGRNAFRAAGAPELPRGVWLRSPSQRDFLGSTALGAGWGRIKPPHSKESIAASSLHQRSRIVFPSQPLLLDGRADAKSRAASHRPRRAGDSRMEARDAFIPRSPSRSWDRR